MQTGRAGFFQSSYRVTMIPCVYSIRVVCTPLLINLHELLPLYATRLRTTAFCLRFLIATSASHALNHLFSWILYSRMSVWNFDLYFLKKSLLFSLLCFIQTLLVLPGISSRTPAWEPLVMRCNCDMPFIFAIISGHRILILFLLHLC